jgi:multimeric flavodoxin WrbA
MGKIAIIYHTLSGNTGAMAEAVAEGARQAGAEVAVKPALEATLDDLLGSDAVAFGSADYFSYIAGALKDFFDRTYYPSKGKVDGKPYAAFVTAGGAGDKVADCLDKFAGHFGLRKVGSTVVAASKPAPEVLDQCRALGKQLAGEAGRR